MSYTLSYKSAAQERAEKAATKAKRSKRYVFEPVLFDRGVAPEYVGELVVKVQPFGCPKNGTMGQCYIGDPETGAMVGMVCVGSLRAA